MFDPSIGVEKAERRIGQLRVAPELMAEVLMIPAGHRIVGARRDDCSGVILLEIEGPEMPVVTSGAPYDVRLLMTRWADGRVSSRFDGT